MFDNSNFTSSPSNLKSVFTDPTSPAPYMAALVVGMIVLIVVTGKK